MMLSRAVMFASTLAIMLATTNTAYAKEAEHSTKITKAEVGVLATIAAIDTDEILLSVIATNKKPNSDVKDFANMMIEQHGSNLTQIIAMVTKDHALPLAGGDAEKMLAAGKKEMVALGGLEGKAFDMAYADAMVKGHQGALDLIDKHLMKTVKTEEVKQFLTETREVVKHHLEDAKKLQSELKA